MTKHVDGLITAYALGHLDRSKANFVFKHISECANCQSKLRQFEALERRLRTTISHEPVATSGEINAWWQHVRVGSQTKLQRREYQIVASMAMAAIAILVPVLASWSFAIPLAQPDLALAGQSTELVRDTVTFELSEGSYFAPNPASALISLQATVQPVLPISAAPAPLDQPER